MSLANTSQTEVGIPSSRVKEGKPHRHRHGIKIKVSTPGSASACVGSILKRLRSSKVSGKSRSCSETTPIDNRGGKRGTSSPDNADLHNVLDYLKSRAIEPSLKFAIGSTSDNRSTYRSGDSNDKTNSNNGSFINDPIKKRSLDSIQNEPVTKSCGLENGMDFSGTGDVGNATEVHNSSKDGITCAKTGMDCDGDIAGSSVGGKQSSNGVVGN